MAKFIIFTSGPVIHKEFASEKLVRDYIEAHAPLKRGWIGKWEDNTYHRFNSKGTFQRGYSVTYRREPEKAMTARTVRQLHDVEVGK